MRFNTTIDNVSPLISYTPATAWAAGTHTDTFWTEYSEGTFTLTGTAGATASFSFNGTGIWVFGALRTDHGIYNVTFDGANSTYSGLSTVNLFQQAIFSAGGLEQGPHTVHIINSPKDTKAPYLDIDHIIWETEIGGDSDAVSTKTEQDSESAFSYGPSTTSWSTTFDNVGLFSGGNGHTTVSTTGYVTYTFTGTAVSIYGALGPSQGPYTVKLDGAAAQNFTALSTEYHAQSLLFRADSLDEGSHTVTITNAPTTPGQGLSVDYAEVLSFDSPITTTSSSQTSSSTSSQTSATNSATDTPAPAKGVSTGIIAGSIIGILALLAIVGFVFVWYSRMRRRKKLEGGPDMLVIAEPFAPNGGGYFSPHSGGYNELGSAHGHSPLYPPSRPNQDMYAARHDVHSMGPNASTPSLYNPMLPPPMAPGMANARYLASPNEATPFNRESVFNRDSVHTTGSDLPVRYPQDPLTQRGPESPLPPLPPAEASSAQASMIPPRKGTASVVLPPSASEEQRREFAAMTEEQLRQRRIKVDGRAQDFGPVIMNPDEELPPDYTQATETLKR